MKRVLVKSFLISAIVVSLVYFYLALPNVSLLKNRNPQTSALMELRDQENREKKLRLSRQRIWVPYGQISDHLKKAVLLSEDASFFSHNGVDFAELKEAFKRDLKTLSFRRGGSTITMQLARNLYLNPAKNPLRKMKEIIIAWQLEQTLSKTRIFEIYLNIVEWGRNIYGRRSRIPSLFCQVRRQFGSIGSGHFGGATAEPANNSRKKHSSEAKPRVSKTRQGGSHQRGGIPSR